MYLFELSSHYTHMKHFEIRFMMYVLLNSDGQHLSFDSAFIALST